MSQTTPCERCGGTIPTIGALAGQCPRCLMEAGLGYKEFVPSTVGRYRVTRLIGQGGMGSVYEAEQDQPRRTVALKIMRPGMASPELLRRFGQETEVGRLQHPGIAQIYEAGTADTGYGPQPYFAMEYVRGLSLTAFVNERRLDTQGRLELMAKICDAVQHAHQRGLIHRDLKPGNILVEESGQPKILDFGVARLTDQDTQTTAQTGLGQLIGTVAYMSPEQILADPLEVDTRSDVYTLGVILYELLSGQLPYRVDKNLHEALSSIRDTDPVRLSSLNQRYRGDVETIAAKALEKDKARRYSSVAELGADLRRYLADEPITARPPDLSYQLQKFMLRRRSLLGGVAALFVILLLVASVSAYQISKHAREAAKARIERDRVFRVQAGFDRMRQAEIDNVTATSWAALLEGAGRNPNMTVREALDRYVASFPGKFAGNPQYEARMRESFASSYTAIGLEEEARKQRQITEKIHPPALKLEVQSDGAVAGQPGISRGAGHRLLLLDNGKVLSLGGGKAETELYDAATGEWTLTGILSRPRTRPVALKLHNGKVLVIGGARDRSAEIYDPPTGEWTPTGSLSIPRLTPAGVVLDDGKVLITGGSASPVAEVYDPANGTWSLAGTMTAIRSGGTRRPDALTHTSTVLQDGRVLVVGGHDADGPLRSAELFDPRTRTWTETGELSTARFLHTATRLSNGKVLVAGGARVFDQCPVLDEAELAEIYDPATGKWSAAASMTSPRAGHSTIALRNGELFLAGVASSASCSGLGSAEIYNPSRNTWRDRGSLKAAAIPLQAIQLENGKILVVGGNKSGAEIFTGETR